MGERQATAYVQHLVLEDHCSKLLENLHSQWQDETYCDLEIKSKDGTLAVHACVLSAFSPKIASIVLKQSTKKNYQFGKSPLYTIKVKFTRKVMKVIMEALYTGVFQAPLTILDEVCFAVRWLKITCLLYIFNRLSDHLKPNVEKNVSGLEPSESTNAPNICLGNVSSVKESGHLDQKPEYMKTRFINKRRPSAVVQSKSKTPRADKLLPELLQYPIKIEVDVADEDGNVVLEEITNNRENEPKRDRNNVGSDPAVKKCYPLLEMSLPLDKQAEVYPPVPPLTKNANSKNLSKMKYPESMEIFKSKKTQSKSENLSAKPKKKQGLSVNNACTFKEMESGTVEKIESDTVKEMASGTVKEMASGTVTEMASGTVKEMASGTVKEMASGTVKEMASVIFKEMKKGTAKEMERGIPPTRCDSVLHDDCSGETTTGVTMTATPATSTVIEEVNDCDPVKIEVDAVIESVQQLKCSKCFKKFSDPDVYNNHVNNHPTFTCKECGQVFQRRFNLTCHFRSEHLGREYLKCRHCGYQANICAELRRHSTTEHRDPKPFYCTYEGCTFRQTKYSAVVCHMRIHTDEREYTCDKCGQTFVAPNSLSSHQRTCYNLQQFLCDLCGQSFNHQQSLKKHRTAIHLGEKPYKCKVCFDSFGDHRNLSRHMRIHNNIFPYPCPLCKQKFRHSNSRKAHLASCHKPSETALANLSLPTAGNKRTSKARKFTGVLSGAVDKSKKKRRKQTRAKERDAPSPTTIYQSSSLTDDFIIPPDPNFDASNSSVDLARVMEGSHQMDNFSFISKPSELYVETGTDSEDAPGSRFQIDADSFDNLLDKSPFYSPSSSPYSQSRHSAFSPLTNNSCCSNEVAADIHLTPSETAVKGPELLQSLAWHGKLAVCPDTAQGGASLLLPAVSHEKGQISFLDLPTLTGPHELQHSDDPHVLLVQKQAPAHRQLTPEKLPSPNSLVITKMISNITLPSIPSLPSDTESLHQLKPQVPINLNFSDPSSNSTSLQASPNLSGGMNNLTVEVITPDGKTLGHVIFKAEPKT